MAVASPRSPEKAIWSHAARGAIVIWLGDLYLPSSGLACLWPWSIYLVRSLLGIPAILWCLYGGYIGFRKGWHFACRWALAPFAQWLGLSIPLLAATGVYVSFYPEELGSAIWAWLTACIDAYAIAYMYISCRPQYADTT